MNNNPALILTQAYNSTDVLSPATTQAPGTPAEIKNLILEGSRAKKRRLEGNYFFTFKL